MFRLKNIFKKKEKEDPKKKMLEDFKKYKIDMNLKSMCLFEELANKSFLEISTNEDIMMALYASLVINNKDLKEMTFDVFQFIMEDEDIIKCMSERYYKIGEFEKQFKKEMVESPLDNQNNNTLYMMDVASTLIVKYGMSVQYVMFEMNMWEIAHYYKTVEAIEKDKLENERFWTYLDILPHIDGKKLRTPQQLVKFPWEKEKEGGSFEDNAKAAKAFFGNKIKEGLENG